MAVRFLRFVSISSLLLLCLWLFLPRLVSQEDAAGDTVKVLDHAIVDEAASQSLDTIINSAQSRPNRRRKSRSTQRSVARTRMTLGEKLRFDFPYDVEGFFPAFIWQTWKTTPTDKDFGFRTQEATWTEQHPTYVHEVITDEVARLLIHHLFEATPEVVEAYDAMPHVILKADFFRYLILLARGGIYSDIDTDCLKPCWDWVPAHFPYDTYGLVVGIEADPDREDWHKWYSRRIQLVQWTLRAKPGHPALVEAIVSITDKILSLKQQGLLASYPRDSAVELTGPAMWTDAVFRYLNSEESGAKQANSMQLALGQALDWRQMTGMKEQRQFGDVIVLPITGFSPGQGHMGSEPFDHPMAMVKHDFEGSWKPEDERMKDRDEKGRPIQWDDKGQIIPYPEDA
ncbi:hypothetical protein BCR37DRAFT_379258 [Protomyces lactucae-debilis]|uniref:Nucleotide-diphospho-sugar transferase n=1 Tax=Protomyces lactucae-debilis TaxID=2754530 RepID=A0A1Y2FKD3_PROLT|nr:uncharacterized protein BCR37DRAFT_379258 [Protomyces lactucae-debilis]ORY83245.1 hypothetical protein BCR37DRAFT_379258 [Protomyces lactucae-debilis]